MAMAGLIQENAEWLRAAARRFCRQQEDAADLLAETTCRLLENADHFAQGRPFKPWALAVMANVFSTWYRRRELIPFAAYDHETANLPGGLYADQAAALATLWATIRHCRRTCTGVEAVLLFAAGYNYAEIAQAQGVGVGTIKSRIRTGRAVLRRAIFGDK